MKRLAIALIVPVLLFSYALGQQTKVLTNAPGVASSLRLLEKWVASQMEYRNQPGLSMGIVHDRDLLWSKGFGSSDLATKTPATSKTIYRIASITKLFTSTAIMQLRDAGKLRLDDPIVKFIPAFKIKNDFPDAPTITVQHLLTHTSGLPGEAAFPYWTDHDFPSIGEILRALPAQQIVFPTETKYRYSNLAMALAGEVVAAASGETYETYIQEHILGPLGMADTSVNLSPEHRKRLAAAYSRRLPDGTRRILPFTDSRGLTPAANMSSTVEDLAKFISLQFQHEKAGGKQVLKGSTLREMHHVHWLFPNWKSGRGLGFSVRQFEGKTLVGHAGWVAGYQTQIGFIVEDRIGVIVLTNADDGSPNTYLEQAFNVVGPAILKAATPAPKPSPPDPAWNAYIGLYTDPTYWDVEVMLLDGKLYLYNHDYPPEENARGALVELVPESPRTFRMTGEDASGDLVVFELGPDGKVQRVKVGENYIFPKK